MAAFAHCDMNVLHAPGICWACDEFPNMQQQRKDNKINFTDEDDPKKAM